MKKIVKLSLAAFLAAGTFAYADATKRYAQGYTYYNVSFQSMDFTTSASEKGFNSSASVDNPVYTIGGVYVINDTYDFSTELSTTLVPTRGTETVTINGVEAKENIEMLNNTIKGYVHYKFTNEHRVVGGLTYNLSSWKRYGGNLVTNEIGQRSMSINMEIGYWYEGYFMPEDKLHVNFKAIGGMPVWDETENTSSNVTFSSRGGYNYNIAVNVGYEFFSGTETGLTMGYSELSRDKDSKDGTIVPEDTFETFYFGVYAAF